MHHYNSAQYCKTETVFFIFPFLQTNITSQMWPCGGKGGPSLSGVSVYLSIWVSMPNVTLPTVWRVSKHRLYWSHVKYCHSTVQQQQQITYVTRLNEYTGWPLSRQCEIPWRFAALSMFSVTHIMPILVLNTCMDANMQLTINSFRQQDFFPDISLICSKIPDIYLTAVKFPDISRFSRQVVTLNTTKIQISIS